MTDRKDHAAEAKRLQAKARGIIETGARDNAFQPHMAAVILLDDARLEAQLAIAEQLRVANLIAYVQMLDGQYNAGNARGEVDVSFAATQDELDASLARQELAQIQVKEALNLD